MFWEISVRISTLRSSCCRYDCQPKFKRDINVPEDRVKSQKRDTCLKNWFRFPHFSLRDTPRWVNKRSVLFLFRSTFVFQKISKNLYSSASSNSTRSSFAPEKCKSKFAFLQFVHLCGRHWQIEIKEINKKGITSFIRLLFTFAYYICE